MRRVLLAMLIGVVTFVLALVSLETSVTALMNVFATGILLGALLVGVPGLVIVSATNLLQLVLLQDQKPAHALLHTAANALPGLLTLIVFRWMPGVGRALPNLQSYLTFLATTALGAALGGMLLARVFFPSALWEGAYLFSGSAAATILLLAPPALILAHRFAPRWRVVLPNKVEPTRDFTVPLEPGGDGTQRRSGAQTLLYVGSVVVAITVLLVQFQSHVELGQRWLALLYLGPVLWVSLNYGLRAGVLTASAAGFSFIVGSALALSSEPIAETHLWSVEQFADLVIFSLIGASIGSFRERLEESREHGDLVERQNEAKLREIFRQTPVLAGLLDTDGTVLLANRTALTMIGSDEADVVGRPFWETQWWSHSEELQAQLRDAVERSAQGETVRFETDYVRADGEARYIDFWLSPIVDETGAVVNLLPAGVDITERVRSAEEVRASRRRLSRLTVELQLSEERQRRRMATYLHDEIGQTLAVLKMKLAGLGAEKDSERVRQLLEETIEKTRSFTLELSPPILHVEGLVAATEWIGQRTCAEHGLDFSFEDDGARKPLDEEVVPLLFRGARELLMNCVKHAGASRVAISIESENGEVRLSVEDDGRGFEVSELRHAGSQGGFGLFSLRERLHALGGRLELSSRPGQGTRGVIVMPIEPPTGAID